MNILVIKTGALGDVLRTSFLGQALRKKFQKRNPRIFWITSERAKTLFINNPYISVVVDTKNKEKFKKIDFDLVINLEEDVENCNFVSSLNFKRLIGAFLNKNNKIDYTKEADYWFNMSMISKFGKKRADKLKKQNKKGHRQIISKMVGIRNYQKYEPFLRLNKTQRKFAQDFLRRYRLSRNDIIIGINTGAADRWPKQLSVKKTAFLIDNLYKKFNAKILLFGGPEETEKNRKILRVARSPLIDTGCGNDLVEFPSLISVCNLFITSDSLGLHVSLALKRKTIVLIGPTSSSEIHLYGLGEKVVAKSKCLCCYKKNCKSMDKIDIHEVVRNSKKLLKQKISILITSFKEPNISKAIESALKQETDHDYNILISAPDKETLNIAKKFQRKYKKIKIFKDPGKGKSYALNLIFSQIKTDILILTDGDVYISKNSVEEIANAFLDPEIGCISGRPFPQEKTHTKYGYWAHFLFNAVHKIRKKAFETNNFIECSGYLFAFRKKHLKKIPTDVAEDTIIPYFFWEKGYKVGYVEKALVYVKNANNLKDWFTQKIRTHKAHGNLGRYVDVDITPKVKSFRTESKGFFALFKYPSNFKELSWSAQLFFSRFLTWMKYFLDTHFFDRHYKDSWKRIESTK